MYQKGDTGFLGFETWFNTLKMKIKMQMYILLVLVLLQAVAVVLLLNFTITQTDKTAFEYYIKSVISLDGDAQTSFIIDGQVYYGTYNQIQSSLSPYIRSRAGAYIDKAIWTFLIYLLWIPINYLFHKRSRAQTGSKYLRGAVLVSAEELNKQIKEPTYLPFGEVKMPVSAETKHMLIIGRPGVGKTVCMSALLAKIIERGDRAIIHDFKGDYLQKFYRPDKDIIFNPFDRRSHYWNFFNEIEERQDVGALGYALIPDAKGAGMDPFWNNAARDVFCGIINYLILEGKTTYKDLYALATSPSDIIGDILKSTPGSEAGATTIADPESKQTGSIMSVLTQYTKIFEYMRETDEIRTDKRFSINDWLSGKQDGNIYITNYSVIKDTIAPILTLMIDLLGRKLLSEKDNSKRRIFFMLDEFGALQRMQSITSILTLARSKGGGVFIGIQDLGQIDKIYGKESKQTIVNACGSSAVFSVADAETSEALSKKYGEFLSVESFVTQSMGVQNNRDGLSINQQKNKERIIMPSEISSLADLNFYINFPGTAVAKSVLTYKGYPDVNEPFDKRTDLSYSKTKNETQKKKEESVKKKDSPEPIGYEIEGEEEVNDNDPLASYRHVENSDDGDGNNG